VLEEKKGKVHEINNQILIRLSRRANGGDGEREMRRRTKIDEAA
jgi:hypothetical protein